MLYPLNPDIPGLEYLSQENEVIMGVTEVSAPGLSVLKLGFAPDVMLNQQGSNPVFR
jgi:hypothetical protein